MTGFGQAAGENERFRMTVTLRGVNHRFLDLSLRLADDLRPFEPALRELLAGRLDRGRLEVSLEAATVGPRRVEVVIDEAVVGAIKTLGDSLRQQGVVSGDLELSDLLSLPDVVKLEVRDPDFDEADRDMLLAVAGRALDQLLDARSAEGENLAAALDERLVALSEVAGQLAARWRGMPGELAESLRRRIAELSAGEGLDRDRLAQEVVYLVDRADITEELDRLQSHVEHFRSVMGEEGSIGKRLEFLTQEILRELNTVGAKCRDSEMTRRVLDAKVLCEQLREQVQNVE